MLPDEIGAYIACRICIAMEESGYTLNDMSEKIGVSRTAVNKWQHTGHITLPHLFALADTVNKPVAWFLPNNYSQEIPPSLINAHIKLFQNI